MRRRERERERELRVEFYQVIWALLWLMRKRKRSSKALVYSPRSARRIKGAGIFDARATLKRSRMREKRTKPFTY